MDLYVLLSVQHPGGKTVKRIVKAITVIAVLLILIGGAAMDSDNIIVPICMVLPGIAWLSLIAWANREEI